ncbi:hypothetical protein RJD39_21815 [Vibrio scophthalmi]|uniref:DUF6844 domain-containing protein n=1 Tax=Vibrio scophthalmi TaxID=45658 RepID=UPI003872E7EC
MKLNKLLAAMLISGFSLQVSASEAPSQLPKEPEVSQEVIGQQSDQDVVKAEAEADTLDLVESKLETYVGNVKASLEKQGKQHKVFVFSGTADLMVDVNDPNWSKKRERALEEAAFNARKEYLETLNTSVENSTISTLSYSNGLPVPTVDDFKTDDQVASFIDKILAVLDGKLDKELQEMGIDPKQYNAAPPHIKRDLYKQSVVDQTERSSYGDLAGMMVVKVFEEVRDSGQGTIGVVMVLSANKRDQVRAMIESDGQVQAQADKVNTKFSNIHAMLSAQKESLYLKSGTQIIYDAEGYPMIIAYGQSGVTYSNSSAKKKIERKVAQKFATNNAWANLARTYNLSGDFKETSSTQNQVSESEKFELIVDSVRQTSSGLTENLIEQLNERTAMTSSIQNMTGVSPELEWRRKHPITGHEMVGTVLVWHPKKVTNAVNLASGKSEAQLDMEVAEPSDSVNSAESEDMFDAADF